MIRSITQQKPEAELDRLLEGLRRIFIIGCGTCTTLTETGGASQVAAMKELLSQKGKMITGHMVLAVACDNLTREAIMEYDAHMKQADALLIMSCAFGVQNISMHSGKLSIPALNTQFIGKETGPAEFNEVCTQCGDCIIGETGGICPVTACHKGLVNGPCGGTNNGKCEIDSQKDCAWTTIYNRLLDLGRLDSMKLLQKPRNHQAELQPGKIRLSLS